MTVGSVQAGFKANIIPDHATLLLNIRAYDLAVREKLLVAIEGIVKAECRASGSPTDPEIEFYESYPLTDDDEVVSDPIAGAFTADQTVLPNHNPGFAPAIQPTLRTGTEAAVVAILRTSKKG